MAVALMVLVCVSLACHKGPTQQDAAKILPALERAFGIAFPTNASNVKAASWAYRSFLDGNSKNVECVARLELSTSGFWAWRNSVTNSMREYEQFAPVIDPRLTKKIAWWDLGRYPRACYEHWVKRVRSISIA